MVTAPQSVLKNFLDLVRVACAAMSLQPCCYRAAVRFCSASWSIQSAEGSVRCSARKAPHNCVSGDIQESLCA